MERLKINYADLESVNYDSFYQKIQIKGPSKLTDEVLSIISSLMETIRCDKLTSIGEDVLNCDDTINILERIVREKHLLCKISKKPNGYYLTYFNTKSAIVSSGREHTLTQLENHILSSYTSLRKDLGFTPSESFNIQRWSEFKTQNLLGNPEIACRFLNVDREIIIFGKKDFVFELDAKIDQFLAHNKQTSNLKVNEFNQTDVIIQLNDVFEYFKLSSFP